MTLQRRDFLKYVGTGALATTLPARLSRAGKTVLEPEQKIHQDYQSDNKGVEYWFLGNGKILVALQTSPRPEAGTHTGLLVMSPDHFGRKMSSYLYHPERGLMNSRFFAIIDDKGYAPDFATSQTRWEYPDSVPILVLEWEAGGCSVREEFFCPIEDAALVRTITITNKTATIVTASSTSMLYPNLMFFDEYDVDRVRMTLTASGYQTLQLFSLQPASAGDRHINVSFGAIPPGEHRTISTVLTLNFSRETFEKKGLAVMREESKKYWSGLAKLSTGNETLDHLFNTSKSLLRSAVARSGKMDGSIWQYNLEWVRDQSMVAVGSTLAGQAEIGASLLRRMLTRSVDEDGKTVDASRHRPPETMELDQNGELLYALWMHWVWTGDDSILREYWNKIQHVADYVLRPDFLDPATGLLKNSREYWERDPNFGVREGYELTYQLWNIIGLQKAADMAAAMNQGAVAKAWIGASEKMKKSFLQHPKFSLTENGQFIKRRLVNGEVQRTFEPLNRKAMPPGMPLNVERVSYCDPDASNVLPIALELIDPQSPLSLQTLNSIELLWNQRWDFGGYARYDVTSEPDSPGPWPFATLFIARAYLETGNHEKTWRALNWLTSIQGGQAGAWFEYYGDRPTPPLPPVGIVVWTWAELQLFFIHHFLGVRPSVTTLTVRPRLLSGLQAVDASVLVRGQRIQLKLRRATKNPSASVNGKTVLMRQGSIQIPFPSEATTIEMEV